MISLGPFRYRNVLAEAGGPVRRVESGVFPMRGRQMYLANAWLAGGLVRPARHALYGDADGSGTDRNPVIARHKAISEALERWAFHALVLSDRAAEFGFDVDPSTTGMSAFPGLLARQARRTSVLEAIERFSLIAWWEGHAVGRQFQTDWPGVSAIAIDGPFGGIAVIAYARTEWGGYIYGHGADESFSGACERAIAELARHERLMRAWWLASVAGATRETSNIFERRCLFFATDEGHELFQERVARTTVKPGLRPEVICDKALPGPWSSYATVWRFAFRPPCTDYLRGERYFFL